MTGVYDMSASDRYRTHRLGDLIGRSFYDPDANYGGVIEAISYPASCGCPMAHIADGHTYALACIIDHLSEGANP